MTTPIHAYLSWGGPYTNDEEWTTGIRMVPSVGLSPAELLEACQEGIVDASGIAVGIHSNSQSLIPGPAQIQWVKFQPINTDGKYFPDHPTNVIEYSPPIAGAWGDDPPLYPLQIARVVSLDTGFRRGRAAHGRMYFPTAAPVTSGDRRTTASAATAFATVMGNAINSWRNMDPAGVFLPSVVSVNNNPALPPMWREISAVRVGRVLDTVRRRRNKLAEDYSIVATP